MTRVPFELVRQKVDKLYDDPIIKTDAEINAQCMFISDFIQACGWDEASYFEELIRRTEGGLTSDPHDLPCKERLASMN
jgi:hypothetical protein